MHPTIQHISTGAAGDPGAAALGIHRHDTITTSDVRPKYYCGERERERESNMSQAEIRVTSLS